MPVGKGCPQGANLHNLIAELTCDLEKKFQSSGKWSPKGPIGPKRGFR